jgi:type IV secretion system protein TrbL
LARAAGGAAASPLRRAAADFGARFQSARAAQTASGGQAGAAAPAPSGEGPPAWARRLRREQALGQGVSAATHAVRDGDSGGPGASIDLSEGS